MLTPPCLRTSSRPAKRLRGTLPVCRVNPYTFMQNLAPVADVRTGLSPGVMHTW